MSIELGPISGSHVYVSDPESSSRGGYSVHALRETLQAITASEVQIAGLAEAVDETMNHPDMHGAIIKERESRLQYLYAANLRGYDDPTQPPVGLLYAEGSAFQDDSRALVRVKLGIWANTAVLDVARYMSAEEVVDTLADFCLDNTDDEKYRWGVPINRQTIIEDVLTGSVETFGCQQDKQNIIEVDTFPYELQKQLLQTVEAFHRQA